MARPSKFSEETEGRILMALEGGATRQASAESAGIHKDTFYAWLKEFSDFSDAVTRAEARCAVTDAAIIQKAARGYDKVERHGGGPKEVLARRLARDAKGNAIFDPKGRPVYEDVVVQLNDHSTVTTFEFDWRAAESFLKRRYKLDWSERVEANISGTLQGAVPVAIEEALDRIYGKKAEKMVEDAFSGDAEP